MVRTLDEHSWASAGMLYLLLTSYSYNDPLPFPLHMAVRESERAKERGVAWSVVKKAPRIDRPTEATRSDSLTVCVCVP